MLFCLTTISLHFKIYIGHTTISKQFIEKDEMATNLESFIYYSMDLEVWHTVPVKTKTSNTKIPW